MRAERTRLRKLKKTKMGGGGQEVKEGRAVSKEIERMLVRQRGEARGRV